MTSNIGIDIAGFQPATVPGDWLFVVVKLSEGMWLSNPRFDTQWAEAAKSPHRGVYHYARPARGTGTDQANFFASQAIAKGFKPGRDMWQLDVEGMLNDGVSGPDWARFVTNFMEAALARLGRVGFLYVGRYFQAQALAPHIARYNWWLPDYGVNDGNVHPISLSGVQPVIHQYSSHGGLDRNIIHNAGRWAALIQPVTPGGTEIGTTELQGGDAVEITTLSIPTDDKGRGWAASTVSFDTFVGATAQGSYPPDDGYWPSAKIAVQNRGGKALVTVQEARPSSSVRVFVAHTS